MVNKLDSINANQRLYNIKCGNGFTCLGFDVAERKRVAVCKWLNRSISFFPLGTEGHYAAYEEAMRLGAAHAAKTGLRCNADLIPELIGKERLRVEVTTPDGEISRFYVGKSTGWMPCHLVIRSLRASGGGPVYFPPGSTVRLCPVRRR